MSPCICNLQQFKLPFNGLVDDLEFGITYEFEWKLRQIRKKKDKKSGSCDNIVLSTIVFIVVLSAVLFEINHMPWMMHRLQRLCTVRVCYADDDHMVFAYEYCVRVITNFFFCSISLPLCQIVDLNAYLFEHVFVLFWVHSFSVNSFFDVHDLYSLRIANEEGIFM